MELPVQNKPLKVAIAIPNAGYTGPESYINRCLFAHHIGKLEGENPGKFEFYWENVGRVLTPLARERLSEWAVEMGCDLMLQIDDDMIIPYDMFDQLYQTMQETNADIVSPLAFMRMPPYYPVIYRTFDGYDHVAHQPYFHREFIKTYPKGVKNLEVDAVGFGSALIKVDLFKRMKKQWFMSTSSAGEDIWFCYCAKKEANAKIVVNLECKLGHVGLPPIIDEAKYREFNKLDEKEIYSNGKELTHV